MLYLHRRAIQLLCDLHRKQVRFGLGVSEIPKALALRFGLPLLLTTLPVADLLRVPLGV